jgi:hypothetical protein
VSFDKHNRSFNEGFFDLPGSDRPRDAAEKVAYEQGQRLRGRGRVRSSSSQTFAEAVGSFFMLAGGAAGFLYGLLLVGRGRAGWLAVGGLTVGGLVAGTVLHGLLAAFFRRVSASRAWAGDERDRESLVRMWEARFGEAPRPELLEQIDDDGRGWTVDRHGNFLLRTRGGTELFVGRRDAGKGVVVESAGGKVDEDAALGIVLAHVSLGKDNLRIGEGRKSARRLIWATARLVGVEVADYVPDAKALDLYDRLSRDSRFEVTAADDA